MLGLQAYATTNGLQGAGDGTQGSAQARQAP